MSNKKMIIRNCPAFAKGIFCKGGDIIDDGCADKTLDRNTLISCQDCTDCLLKQIVELCKGIKCPCEYKGADCWECTESGARRFADRILQLLDIQEVE